MESDDADVVWCILCGRTSVLAGWVGGGDCCPFCQAGVNRRYTWARCLQINPMLPETPEVGREYRLSNRLYLNKPSNLEKEPEHG
ncbi:MAG: hypothetical protein M3Y13_00320 [Armatimonadota bacterium]|nr:hypothetical protein [Armatimonadota bacterium]